MAVLIIALQNDLHADAVVNNLLHKNIRVIRIDPTVDKYLPQAIEIKSGSTFSSRFIFNDSIELDISDLTGIYCRFSLETLTPTDDTDALKHFSDSENLAAFLAPLRMVDSSKWINDPWLESRADCRILQSKLARSVGLNVPEFIVSNSYHDLIRFYEKHEKVIIKPISDAPLAAKNGKFVKSDQLIDNKFMAPYAVEIDIDVLTNLDYDCNISTLLQAKVDKLADIRATVIDNEVFAAKMNYSSGEPIDFRRVIGLDMSQIELPVDIHTSLVQLVKILGIRFASCDLLIGPNSQYYFLEANVQGNWLWTENEANLPISRTIAEFLL